MKCPVCRDVTLVMSERQGIEIDYCPQCRGVWLDRGELDKIIERSASPAYAAAPASPAPAQHATPAPPPHTSSLPYPDSRQHHGYPSHGQHPAHEQHKHGSHKHGSHRRKSLWEELFDD